MGTAARAADRHAPLGTPLGNPYHDAWSAQLAHQKDHDGDRVRSVAALGEPAQPNLFCFACMYEGRPGYVDDGREAMAQRWAWAVPDPEAVRAIAAESPKGVVEIGAGTGYWARMLYEAGVDVAAFDRAPPGGKKENHWHKDAGLFYPVEVGGPDQAAFYPDRTLLLCWPPYDTRMAYDALTVYGGDTVVYVGEPAGGCTADSRFHYAVGGDCGWGHGDDYRECRPADHPGVSGEWRLGAMTWVPSWWGLHDRLHIYHRTRPSTTATTEGDHQWET